MVQIQGKTVLLRVGGEFELSGFNCSVKGQGKYFEGLISSALITLNIPQMDSCWTLLHSLLLLQQTSKVCRVDVKTALREEQINPTVSLKTHAQPVRYSDAFVFICHLTVTQCRAAELVDFFFSLDSSSLSLVCVTHFACRKLCVSVTSSQEDLRDSRTRNEVVCVT